MFQMVNHEDLYKLTFQKLMKVNFIL